MENTKKVIMEQKKTLSELYQECKLKQETEQKKKEFMAKIVKILYTTNSTPVFPG